MCICVNCKWLDRFKTYYDFLKIYEVVHLTSHQDVNAKNLLIHTCLFERKNRIFSIEWDVRSCSSFYKEISGWSKIKLGLKVLA